MEKDMEKLTAGGPAAIWNLASAALLTVGALAPCVSPGGLRYGNGEIIYTQDGG
jgi:hypothetical protein